MLVMGVGVVSQAMGALRLSVHGFPHANLGRRSAFLSLHSVAECRSLLDQNSAVCIAARATGALERGLRKQASCADSDTTGSTAQLWWEVNEREEET
ncbi:unnamed protein product [Musa hybrid cultivar]